MTKLRKTISLLLLVCCVLSLLPAPSAGADSCVHVPDETGRCMYCGTLLVTENYSAAFAQTGALETPTEPVPVDDGSVSASETVSDDAVTEEDSDSSEISDVQVSDMLSGCSHVLGEDGRCGICEMELVASGENRYFSSVQEAFAYGGNIRLLRDIDSDEDTSVTVASGQTVSLDLNGKKLGVEHLFSINNYGTLTVCDSSDDKGEIFGSIYTKGFEEREYREDGSYIVTDSAYGAKTVISGGRLLGDLEAGHDSERPYTADELKPNPSLVFESGYMIGGRFSLPEKERGEILINGGCFTVEPPADFIKKGWEAEHSDGYYRIVRIKYIAGWESTPVSAAAGLSSHARSVAEENSAVNNFYTEDLGYVDVSDLLLANGLVFDPESDRVVCSLEIKALNAVTEGEGINEKVSSMSFAVNPVFRLYRGGQFMSLALSWEQIEGWGTTLRFPVDSVVTNKYVNVYSGEKLIQEKAEIVSSEENRYVQLYVDKGSFAAEIRYEVYVPETCAVVYTPEGAPGETVHESVAGGGTLTVIANPYLRDHYTFAGWMGTDGIVYSEGETVPYVIDDMSFSALWEPDSFELFYELDGGTNSPNNPLSYVYDDTLDLSEPEKEGAIFAGWYDNPDFEGEPVTVLSPGTFGEKKLYAKWLVSVTVMISGDGAGIVSDTSKQYASGDVTELLSGGSFSANIFNTEGSYISAVLVNGENTDVSSGLILEDIRESVIIEVVFSAASAANGQLVDFSEAKAENGSDLSSSLLSRAENAFENANVTDFSDTGIEEAVDLAAAKAAFASETGEEVEEYDTVNIMLQMSVLTVSSDDGNRITGYKIDIKPVMTVVSADGVMKNGGVPVVVPNEAIMHAVTFRIPIDQLAYMDDIVAFHEGELMGYFKIEGESPNRYVEITTDSFSVFEIQAVVGSTNHPQAAIGQYGFLTLSDAVSGVNAEDIIYILVEKSELSIPSDRVTGSFNAPVTLTPDVALSDLISQLSMTTDVVTVKKDSGTYSIMLASDQMMLSVYENNLSSENGAPVVYHGNGGETAEGQDKVEISDTEIRDNSNTDIGFINGKSEFYGWNTKADGSGTAIQIGDTVDPGTEVYAIWAKVKVSFRDGTERKYLTLNDAYAACDSRDINGADTVILLTNIDLDNEKGNICFGKELFIDLNGFDITYNRFSFKNYPGYFEQSDNYRILKWENDKYQVRKKVTIKYVLDPGNPKTETKVGSSFRDRDELYIPRLPGATFKCWYYDTDFERPVTQEEKRKYSIPAVPAPEWPEDITVYARWVYAITVYSNNYGYIEYAGRKLSSGDRIEVNRHSSNEFAFRPYDGFKVYNVTADNVKLGERYSWGFYEVEANHILVVTFARGFYNPFTGDEGRSDLWLTVMSMSALLAGAALLLLRRKKGKQV